MILCMYIGIQSIIFPRKCFQRCVWEKVDDAFDEIFFCIAWNTAKTGSERRLLIDMSGKKIGNVWKKIGACQVIWEFFFLSQITSKIFFRFISPF
jgi:hypothetical protein